MNTKALRQKILDLAIHGKLVPQDPNDEHASVLLERIRAEKEQLIKEGKIKKQKETKATCGKPNYPFELPNGWVWTTLGEIGNWQSGATPSRLNKEYYGGNIPWLKTGDLNDNIITNIPESITQKALDETSVRLNPKGSVLIAMYGATIGKVGILSFPATTNQACCACYEFNINQMYLFYFLLANRNNFIAMGGGGAQPNISKEKILSENIPLPPLNEQARIKSEIERWLSFVDVIEKEKSDLQATIKQAKTKILDLAIHGKLVPQDPRDEPAVELLKRINPKAEISFENPQYGRLPSSWCETTLGDLFNHNTGKALNSSNTEGTMMDYLTTSNVYWNTFDFSVVKRMLFKENELDKCRVTKGDLLVCEGGDIGRAAIWNQDYDICIQNHIHRLRPKVQLSVPFYYYTLFYLKANNMIGGKGIGLLGLSSNALHKIHFPLPPLSEQHRIVAKIEELFAQLDKIEASL